MTLLLSDAEVRAATDMAMLVENLEKALVAEADAGGLLLPPRLNLNHSDGFLRVMPAVMPGTGALGLKMFHGSLERGVRYVVIVCNLADGAVRAVLDAAYLTAARTGATSALATQHLARPEARTVGLIGSGLEAETNLLAIMTVRPVTDVKVYSRNPGRRRGFAERITRETSADVRAVDTPEEAVRGADVVIVATNTGAHGDVAYRGAWMEPGQHIVSIGSTSPQLREIDERCFLRADLTVFDATAEQVHEESGDLLALRRAHTDWNGAELLTNIVTGVHPGRTWAEQITLFKSVGTAAQDLVGALCVADEAARRGIGRQIADLAEARSF